MKKFVVIGAGGHGRVVADIARACEYEEIVFLDDADTPLADGKVADFIKYREEALFIVAIGNSKIREKIQNQLTENECRITTLVHPNAVVGSDVSIGAGTVVMAGTVQVEEHTWIGAGAVISDNVVICKECMIGAGAVVVKDIKESGTYVGVPARKIK